jgi:hypothetical protein
MELGVYAQLASLDICSLSVKGPRMSCNVYGCMYIIQGMPHYMLTPPKDLLHPALCCAAGIEHPATLRCFGGTLWSSNE